MLLPSAFFKTRICRPDFISFTIVFPSLSLSHFLSTFFQVGADFYSGRIDYPISQQQNNNDQQRHNDDDDNDDNKKATISVQVWDTPGRERYSNPNNNKKKTAMYMTSFSDHFLKNIDAVVLVYDVSSSTSFTHVLKWHSELMERLKNMELNGDRARPLPIVIVGNKVDIVEERDMTQKELRRKRKTNKEDSSSSSSGAVRQRDVLGLRSDFRGNDYRYEYYTANTVPSDFNTGNGSIGLSPTSASITTASSSAARNAGKQQQQQQQQHTTRNRFELSTYVREISSIFFGCGCLCVYIIFGSRQHRTTHLFFFFPLHFLLVSLYLSFSFSFFPITRRYMGTKTNYLESILSSEVYRGSYLDSLLSSEDKSHPDRDMVLLWCMRNGLMHMEVSAKRGDGINDLIQQLIKIAIEQQQQQQQQQLDSSNAATYGGAFLGSNGTNMMSLLQRNDELDLHKRYAPKSQSCFWLPFQRCCKP
jgi:GTPase SAR1 family protein